MRVFSTYPMRDVSSSSSAISTASSTLSMDRHTAAPRGVSSRAGRLEPAVRGGARHKHAFSMSVVMALADRSWTLDAADGPSSMAASVHAASAR